ncbi:MAG: class I SAM-dependent methyltransferase [Candidatus Methanomethylophilaceae archaeon]
MNIINSHLDSDGPLKVLDVGTGPGFFPVILGREGHKVTAVDCTQAMLDEAAANCKAVGVEAEFFRMDAQNLDFEDESFDLVISRNLIWNLEDPERAYREWMRVLREGGKLMVFDGNHYLYLYDKDYAKAEKINSQRNQHTHLGNVDVNIIRDIARDLPLSRQRRPQWDVDLLIEMGVQSVTLDTDGRDSYRIDIDGKTVYLPYSFFICADK